MGYIGDIMMTELAISEGYDIVLKGANSVARGNVPYPSLTTSALNQPAGMQQFSMNEQQLTQCDNSKMMIPLSK